MQLQSIPLRHEQTLLTLPAREYRTDRLTAVFAVPLQAATAAEYAILPGLLTRSSRRYPTLTALNRGLDGLYGAAVTGSNERLGGWQILRFSVSYLRQNYTLSREDLTGQCTALLLEMLFDPALEGDAFRAADFAQEQRCLLERLQSEMNNKRLYARQQCVELLCPEHPYSVDPDGTPASVQALTAAGAVAAWRRLLSTARVHWIYQGDGDTAALGHQLEQAFAALPQRRAVLWTDDPSYTIKESARTDTMHLKQAKLVLGFRIAAAEPDGAVNAARLMNALFGGCASSLLFRHVREEQSLCYYCSSTYDRFRSLMLVDSGVETANAGRTKEEVLRQLEALRQGQFSDEELEAARASLIQAFMSMEETPAARESFYVSQTVYEQYKTPEQTANELRAVTREDVCRVARLVHFDTTYLLCPQGEEEAL